MSLSLGYLLPTREIVMNQAVPDFHQILDLAEQAEALGFDSLWVGDSVLARPRLEALTTLAAVAARTRRLTVGTAVLLPMLRHPVVLANQLANLDHIAQGRLIVGLGLSGRTPDIAREFAACGVAMAHRAGLFEETVTLMRRLWTEPEVTFEGCYFQVESVCLGVRPLQHPSIPLWLAAAVDPGFRRVLRLGDGWLPISPSPEVFAAHWARLQVLGREMGRDARALHRCLYTTLNINPDVGQAEQEVRAHLEGYYGVPLDVVARLMGHCAGPAESCVRWLKAFVAAGAQTIILRFASPDPAGQLKRFAAEVLPYMHEASADRT